MPDEDCFQTGLVMKRNIILSDQHHLLLPAAIPIHAWAVHAPCMLYMSEPA